MKGRFYIRDFRMFAFAVLFILCVLYITATILTHSLQDLLLGQNPSEEQNSIIRALFSWVLIPVIPLTIISGLALLIYGIQAFALRARRKPLACPKCQTDESRIVGRMFNRKPVVGTDWQIAVCPFCGYDWHIPR